MTSYSLGVILFLELVSFSLASQQLAQRSLRLSWNESEFLHVDTESSGSINNTKGTRWAVLIAGSSDFSNYRHQADVCHAYQILRKGGLKDENIIVFMYDDIAFNEENPRPGVIINRPQGEDVYEGVPKDYTGRDANVNNLFAVILANKTALTGGSGKVLDTGPDDYIFIFYTDHGAAGMICMPQMELIYGNDLFHVLKKKHDANTFKSMVFYLESCESGSIFAGQDLHRLNIFATTAANESEYSYATYCQDEEICLGDMYSVSWMEDSEKHDLRTETLDHQYKVVRRRTLTEQPLMSSHVMKYGLLSLGTESLYKYIGTNPANDNKTYTRHSSSASISKGISQYDADLLYLWHKFRRAPKGSQKQLEAQKQLVDEINYRVQTDHNMRLIPKLLFGSETGLMLLETVRPSGQPIVDDWNCLKALVRTYGEQCGSLSRYALTYSRVLANMCNAGVMVEQMAKASAQACK